MASPRFLFIPGAWHGAWCFDPLFLELQRRAVKCSSVDLPGLGDDETAPAEATFEAGVQRVVGMIGNRKNVTLVGHSFGAFYATEAALQAGGRVREVVYLASYVPIEGDTYAVQHELMPLNAALQSGIRRNEEQGVLELEALAAAEYLYGDVMEGISAAALTRLRPQPLGPLREAKISEGDFTSFRRRAVVAENDRVFDPQDCVAAADRAGVSIESVPTGHMPFLSMWKLLADVLLGVD